MELDRSNPSLPTTTLHLGAPRERSPQSREVSPLPAPDCTVACATTVPLRSVVFFGFTPDTYPLAKFEFCFKAGDFLGFHFVTCRYDPETREIFSDSEHPHRLKDALIPEFEHLLEEAAREL